MYAFGEYSRFRPCPCVSALPVIHSVCAVSEAVEVGAVQMTLSTPGLNAIMPVWQMEKWKLYLFSVNI